MLKIVCVLIGIIYGIGTCMVFVGTVRFLKKKIIKNIDFKSSIDLIQWQLTLMYITSCLTVAAFFLTSLVFKPFFDDWHFFKKMFGMGFIVGITLVFFSPKYLRRSK